MMVSAHNGIHYPLWALMRSRPQLQPHYRYYVGSARSHASGTRETYCGGG